MSNAVTKTLSFTEIRRFKALKEIVIKHATGIGSALIEIRDDKLYRDDYGTWEEFLEKEFGISRSYFHRILEFEEIKMLPIGNKIANEAQAREIKKVPENKRQDVISDIETAGRKVTAKTIEEFAASITDPPDESQSNGKPDPLGLDEIGRSIPAKQQAMYDRRQVIDNLLSKISDVRSFLRRSQEANDILFRRLIISRVISELDSVYSELKTAQPFVLCPYCQGQTTENCMGCKGIGFLSKFHWETTVPSELREMCVREAKK